MGTMWDRAVFHHNEPASLAIQKPCPLKPSQQISLASLLEETTHDRLQTLNMLSGDRPPENSGGSLVHPHGVEFQCDSKAHKGCKSTRRWT